MIDGEGVEARLFAVWLLAVGVDECEAGSLAGESDAVGESGGVASVRVSPIARARALETVRKGPEQFAQMCGVPGAVRERHS